MRLASGEHIGTQLVAECEPLHAREQWIVDQLRPEGRVYLDAGATRALLEKKTSLLPVGIKQVDGDFVRGEVVGCVDESGREIARGLVNYASSEVRLIMGRHTEELEGILGYMNQPELIHRDNLVMLEKR